MCSENTAGLCADAVVRFWMKVDKTDGCWIWKAAKSGRGYGGFKPHKNVRQFRAHRLAYELLVGPIPDGLHLDHLCRNPPCVNPAHLEPVTNRENLARSPITVNSINLAKTACVHGHPFDEQNTAYTKGGGRRCRACARRISAEREQTGGIRTLFCRCSSCGWRNYRDRVSDRPCPRCGGQVSARPRVSSTSWRVQDGESAD